MARYSHGYDHPPEPGWTGGGRYPGVDYRTSGYRIRRDPSDHGNGGYDRESRFARRAGPRDRTPRRGEGPPPPRYGPRREGAASGRYAADYHGGGYGPDYYTGGYYGRTLRRRGERGTGR